MKNLKGRDIFFFKVLLSIFLGTIIVLSTITMGAVSKINIQGDTAAILSPIVQVFTGNSAPQQPTTQAPAQVAPSTPAQPQSSAPATPTAPAAPATPAGDDTPDATTSTTASGTPAASGTLSASSSKEEIVAYFNTSANKIKTNATGVTRNYEDLSSIPEKLQVPSAVSSIAEMAMNTFLKKNETPVEYASQEEIIANYPVAGETWVSQITADQLSSATCEDDGTNYKITLNFNDDLGTSNPTPGTGYGKAFNVLKVEDIALDYPGLSISNVNLTYFGGNIVCTVEKATGNMTAATYTMPLVLALTAKIVVKSVDAQIGMNFKHDYTIRY